jgi:hypothetical protein
MSYATKNSIYLFILLVIIVVFFAYFISKTVKDIDLIENLYLRNLKEHDMLSDSLPKENYLQLVQYYTEKYNYIEMWTLTNSKFFLNEDNTKITWEYLQNIVNRFNEPFQFNFSVSNKGRNDTDYNISGSSRIRDLYVFISILEKLGALYTLETLTMNSNFKESNEGPVNDINFTLLLKPHVDQSTGKRLQEQELRRINYSNIMNDPLRPAIYNPMTDPEQEKYVHYEQLKLISFTPGQAYFSQGSSIISLTPMQKVAYGYFSHIDESNNRAVFRINKTGLYETVYQVLE